MHLNQLHNLPSAFTHKDMPGYSVSQRTPCLLLAQPSILTGTAQVLSIFQWPLKEIENWWSLTLQACLRRKLLQNWPQLRELRWYKTVPTLSTKYNSLLAWSTAISSSRETPSLKTSRVIILQRLRDPSSMPLSVSSLLPYNVLTTVSINFPRGEHSLQLKPGIIV